MNRRTFCRRFLPNLPETCAVLPSHPSATGRVASISHPSRASLFMRSRGGDRLAPRSKLRDLVKAAARGGSESTAAAAPAGAPGAPSCAPPSPLVHGKLPATQRGETRSRPGQRRPPGPRGGRGRRRQSGPAPGDRGPPSPAAGSGGGTGPGNRRQNTLLSKITVYYPFHPLHGLTLAVAEAPWRRAGLVAVLAPSGYRVKIPVWMTSPQAAGFAVSMTPAICVRGLLRLADLLGPCLDRRGEDGSAGLLVSSPTPGVPPESREDADDAAEPGQPAGPTPEADRRARRADDRGGGASHGRSDHSGLPRGRRRRP